MPFNEFLYYPLIFELSIFLNEHDLLELGKRALLIFCH